MGARRDYGEVLELANPTLSRKHQQRGAKKLEGEEKDVRTSISSKASPVNETLAILQNRELGKMFQNRDAESGDRFGEGDVEMRDDEKLRC